MKLFLLLFSLILFTIQTAKSTDCFQGDTLFFYSQADIDLYGETYSECVDLDASIIIDPVNSEINSLVPLENIESVNGVLIVRNTNLVKLTGLHNINGVGFGVSIINNNSIIGLTGLDGLYRIGEVSESHIDEVGFLKIESNDNLLNLWGIDNLDLLMGDLEIQENINLVTLYGLESLNKLVGFKFTGDSLVNSTVVVKNNKNLSGCSVMGICALRDYNNFIFENNADGCNSVTTVQAGCSFISVEEVEDSQFEIYPNPTEDSFRISSASNLKDIILTDVMGRVVYKSINTNLTDFDLSNEPVGIYYISIDGKVSKIVKK